MQMLLHGSLLISHLEVSGLSLYRCILHNSYTEYGDLSDESQPWSQVFEHFFPSRWCCLGRLMMCGLAGVCMSLGVDFEVPKPHALSHVSLYFVFGVQDVSPQPPVPAAMCSICHHGRVDAENHTWVHCKRVSYKLNIEESSTI